MRFMRFNRNDYILSFLVQGVNVFVTDIHVDVYRDLRALFLIDNGMFKQYFAKNSYEKALNLGLEFYSNKSAFDNYRKALIQHSEDFRKFFTKEIKNKDSLSIDTVKIFFNYTVKLCKDYTWMNFEHTDKAFSHQENNLVLKKNLSKASKYKDTVRSYMNEVLFDSDGYTNEVFSILGKQFGIGQNVIGNLTQKEILNLFENKKPDIKLVSNRQKAFVINFDRSLILEGQTATEILNRFRDEVITNSLVMGRTASSGKVIGPVKIISVDYANMDLLHREIDKMHKGDILVAETTAPELIIACKKAAAIVTDIGGLLSHAAIVSREFGIPCIVGTENATKVFKDGDIVEVDAVTEKGIAKKI